MIARFAPVIDHTAFSFRDGRKRHAMSQDRGKRDLDNHCGHHKSWGSSEGGVLAKGPDLEKIDLGAGTRTRGANAVSHPLGLRIPSLGHRCCRCGPKNESRRGKPASFPQSPLASGSNFHSQQLASHTHLTSLGLTGLRAGGAAPVICFVHFTRGLGHDETFSLLKQIKPREGRRGTRIAVSVTAEK